MMAFLLSGCGETATPSTEDQNVTSTPTQEMEGTAATGFDYKENDDGTITVCGYDGEEWELVIPDTIDGKTVTEIERMAFYHDVSLTSVVIPETVTSLGESCFEKCEDLETVVLPKHLTEIPRFAFRNCQNLKDIQLPEELKTIGKQAFEWCSALKKVSFPDSLETIEEEAFMNSGLETITIPPRVTVINPGVFNGTSIEELDIPSTVTTINQYAFHTCFKLREVTLHDGVTFIGPWAFGGQNELTEIVIPSTVADVYEYTFADAPNLSAVKFEGDAPKEYVSEYTAPLENNYKVYYHEGAAGFSSPEWNGFRTEIW